MVATMLLLCLPPYLNGYRHCGYIYRYLPGFCHDRGNIQRPHPSLCMLLFLDFNRKNSSDVWIYNTTISLFASA